LIFAEENMTERRIMRLHEENSTLLFQDELAKLVRQAESDPEAKVTALTARWGVVVVSFLLNAPFLFLFFLCCFLLLFKRTLLRVKRRLAGTTEVSVPNTPRRSEDEKLAQEQEQALREQAAVIENPPLDASSIVHPLANADLPWFFFSSWFLCLCSERRWA
jgi:hypothetical protein